MIKKLFGKSSRSADPPPAGLPVTMIPPPRRVARTNPGNSSQTAAPPYVGGSAYVQNMDGMDGPYARLFDQQGHLPDGTSFYGKVEGVQRISNNVVRVFHDINQISVGGRTEVRDTDPAHLFYQVINPTPDHLARLHEAKNSQTGKLLAVHSTPAGLSMSVYRAPQVKKRETSVLGREIKKPGIFQQLRGLTLGNRNSYIETDLRPTSRDRVS